MIENFWFAFLIFGSTATASAFGAAGMLQFIIFVTVSALTVRALKLRRYNSNLNRY